MYDSNSKAQKRGLESPHTDKVLALKYFPEKFSPVKFSPALMRLLHTARNSQYADSHTRLGGGCAAKSKDARNFTCKTEKNFH